MSKTLGTIGFRKCGAWKPNTFYRKDDMAEHDRSSRYALEDHTSSETFDEEMWGYLTDARGVTEALASSEEATSKAVEATRNAEAATEESTSATEKSKEATAECRDETEKARKVTEMFGDNFSFVETAEFVFAIADSAGRILCGIRYDGSFYAPKGMTEDARNAIEKEISERYAMINKSESGRYIASIVDSENRVIGGIDKNGNVHFSKDLFFNGVSMQTVESEADTIYHLVDKDGKVLFNINREGKAFFQRGMVIDGHKSGIETTETQNLVFAITDKDGNMLAAIDRHGALIANKIAGVGEIENTESEEMMLSVVDNGGHLLFGVKHTGEFIAPKFALAWASEGEDMEFIYVILDSSGRICWGIRSNGAVYQPKGAPEEVKASLNEIRKTLEQIKTSIETADIENININNIAIEKVMYNGNQGRTYLGNVALQAPGETDYCIIMMYGQSLSNGSENPAGFDDPVVDGCYMLGNNVWNTSGTQLQPLRVGGTVRADGDATGTRQDTIVSAVNAFVTLYRKERPWDKNTKFIACSLGVGGRTVAQLSGADRYPNCNEHQLDARVKPFFNAVKAIADNEGKTISLSAVFWKQGESDYGTGHIGKSYDEWLTAANASASETPNSMSMSGCFDAYFKGLTLLKEDIFKAAKDIFGESQSNRPVFMPYSVCGTYINNAYMTINMATSKMADEQDDVIQVGPTYVTPDYNGGHLSMNGYRWYGEYCAKALFHVFLKGINWKPMQPYNYEVVGNKIYIYIDPIVPPLRFDKYTIDNAYKDNGFIVRHGTLAQLDSNKSASSLNVQITDISIVENCVVLTCGGIEKFENAVEVIYAGQGASGYSGHNQGAGNLRDSDTWAALYSYRNDEADHGSISSTYWGVAHVASETELNTLEFWDATFAKATGYSEGDLVLYNAIEYATPIVLTSKTDNNKSNPYNPVNYHTQDVKGSTIFGKPYPMQNWCLNFYKRIILS